MGFGSPGTGATNYKPSPPERGSFPLDHDGECKHLISNYLKCLKINRGVNEGDCRLMAKDYLGCRMEKNLMAPDDFKNLGLIFEKQEGQSASSSASAGTGNNAQTGS